MRPGEPWLAALLVVAAGALTVGAVPLRGQADTVPAYRTEEISVRVTRASRPLVRLPFAISAFEIDALSPVERALSLDESLRGVPGVFVGNRRNFALGDRLVIRGVGARAQFGVRGLRVLADGIPLTLADGQSTLTNLDLASAGRVEVIRGPASALYGNAGGGVVSFETRRPEPGARLEPALLAGPYGFWQARLQASGRAGDFGYLGSASYLDSQGFRAHADARIARGNLVVSQPTGGGELRGVINFYHTPFARSPGSLDRDDALLRPRSARPAIVAQGVGEEATQGQAGLALELPLAGRNRVRAAGWGLWRDLWNAIPGRIIELDRLAGGLRGEWRGTLVEPGGRGGGSSTPGLRWVGGVDLEAQRDRRRESENLGIAEPGGRAAPGPRLLDQREGVLGVGPFLQLEASWGSRWTLTAAARVDAYRFDVDDAFLEDGDDSDTRTFTELSPTVGLAWSATPSLHLYGNLATAFQTPTTSELSNRPDGRGGFDPDLEAERIRSLEIGLRGSLAGARLGYTAALFRADVTNALVPFEGPSEETFFRNAGKVSRLGIEIGLVWAPWPELVAELTYTAQRLRFEQFAIPAGDVSGNTEPGVPEQWMVLGLRHLAAFGLESAAVFRWVDAFPVNDLNTAWNWSSRVVDLRFRFERADLPVRPFLGIDNLFDERYNGSVVPNAFGGRYYEPAPGIEVWGGLSWPLQLRAP